MRLGRDFVATPFLMLFIFVLCQWSEWCPVHVMREQWIIQLAWNQVEGIATKLRPYSWHILYWNRMEWKCHSSNTGAVNLVASCICVQFSRKWWLECTCSYVHKCASMPLSWECCCQLQLFDNTNTQILMLWFCNWMLSTFTQKCLKEGLFLW